MYMSIEEFKRQVKDSSPRQVAELLDMTITSRKDEVSRLEQEIRALQGIWADVTVGANALEALQALK